MKTKDMRKLHHLPKLGEVVKKKWARIRNYGDGSSAVTLAWAQTEKMALEQIFILEVTCKHGDKHRLVLDYQEFLHYARAIPDWKQSVEEMKENMNV